MEVVDIEIGRDGNAIIQSDKLLVVDADTIAFAACQTAEVLVPILPKDFYHEDEWVRIQENLDETGEYSIESDLEVCKARAKEKLERIMFETGCKRVQLHFTIGRESFRYDLYPEYKANRTGMRTPKFIKEVKEWMCQEWEGYLHSKIEADDAVAIMKNWYGDDIIVAAVDKDVLRALPGRHFNYYESAKYNINMKWQETAMEEAIRWPYLQALMGDKSDNIPGLPGIGEKKAAKLLPEGRGSLQEAVIKAYENAGKTAEDAILAITLCQMGDIARCQGTYDLVDEIEGVKLDKKEILWKTTQ